MTDDVARWRRLEGRRVRLVLRDGTHLGSAELVSAGRGTVTTCWIVTDDGDRFVSHGDVIDLDGDPALPAPRAADVDVAIEACPIRPAA